jgi:putative oxidoreductase
MLDNIGRLVLRLTVGGLMLLHGVAKLKDIGGTVEFMGGELAKVGLPQLLSYGVFVGEVIAPLLIMAGILCRPAAIVLAINMLFAIGLVHSGDIFQFTPQGGSKIELQLFYLLGAVVIALLGAGQFSVSRGKWPWD